MALMFRQDSAAGVGGGLDHVEMDAVGEDVPGPAEHDHPHRALSWAYR